MHVIDKLVGLQRAGSDGVQLAFLDVTPDVFFFGEAVLPLIYQAGPRL